MFNLKHLFRAPEAKASRTAQVLAFESGGRARWTPRDYAALAREGYLTNAIVHRAVRLIAENAASCGYLLYEGAAERDAHPLLALLTRPNARQDGASFFEALYAHMLLAGNAYVEAVALDGQVRELHALRPDRMKVVPGHDGWPEAYEYSVAGRSVRFDQLASAVPPILHLTFFHPLDDHYGLAPVEAAAVAVDAAIQIGVLDLDRTSPPLTPAAGDRHVVASGATGAWAGQTDAIATWEDGAWRFLTPKLGWCIWSDADATLLVWDGAGWLDVVDTGTMSGSVAQLGINDTSSSPNLLTVRSNDALFNAIDVADSGTGDMRVQISKETSADTASVVFSNAFSGRAEFGLIGSDAFKLKVSNDGSSFVEAFNIDQVTGNLTLPRGLSLTGVISPSQITSNQNDYNPAGIGAASILQMSSDASRSVSGLAGGAEGRVVTILNTGSQTITLLDEGAASTAANRFTLGGDLAVTAKQAAILRYDGTASRWYAIARAGVASLGGREVLTANRTYYVRTDGSNSNNGLANTSGGAFLTLQKAIDAVAALDISIYNVTIQVGAGTYTAGALINGAWIGSGTVTLTGDLTTPASCIVSTTSASCISVASGGRLSIGGFELRTTTSGNCLNAGTGGSLTVTGAMAFGACASNHIAAAQYGSVVVSGVSYAISGNASRHFNSSPLGYINVFSTTITLTGTPAFASAFAFADRLGFVTNTGVTYLGAATGTRYTANSNAVINTNGGGANFFPGSVAGATATGGQYL